VDANFVSIGFQVGLGFSVAFWFVGLLCLTVCCIVAGLLTLALPKGKKE